MQNKKYQVSLYHINWKVKAHNKFEALFFFLPINFFPM